MQQRAFGCSALFLACGLVLFACFPAAAWQGPAQQSTTRTPAAIGSMGQMTYSVSGRVLDERTGEPIEGARVKLETFTGLWLQQMFVDSTGMFRFFDVADGNYYVSVSHPGYKGERRRVAVAGGPASGVFFHLRPKPGSHSPLFIEPIDVDEHLVPEKARRQFDQAIDAVRNNDLDQALTHFENALEIYPEYASAWHGKGAVHFRLGALDPARSSFQKAIEINPNAALPRILLGAVLNSQQLFSQAVEHLEKGVKVDADNWLGRFELGRAYWRLGDLENAEGESLRAHELNPEAPQVHLLRINLYLAQDEFEAAVEEMDEFLELFPQLPFAEKVREKRTALAKLLEKREE